MKTTFSALMLLAASGSSARAEREGALAIDWTLQVDPLTTALGYVHVQLEYAPSPHWSFYLGPSLKLLPGLLAEDDDVAFIGLGAELGVRYYFEGDAPRGWWALVRGVLAHLATTEGPDLTGVGGYVSALGGYTWIFGDVGPAWVVSLGLGVQYLDYEIGNAGNVGVLPAAHTTIGVAF